MIGKPWIIMLGVYLTFRKSSKYLRNPCMYCFRRRIIYNYNEIDLMQIRVEYIDMS